MAWFLGIDLGTTFTAAAAVVGADGRPRGLARRPRTAVPSVLLIARTGSSWSETPPSDYARRTEPCRARVEARVGDPVPFMLGGAPYAAELLQARLLRWVVDRMATELGARSRPIAVTYPASWGAYKLDLLRSAVRQVTSSSTCTCPSRWRRPPRTPPNGRSPSAGCSPSTTSGRTFDCCVVRRDPEGFEVVGTPEGDRAARGHRLRRGGARSRAPQRRHRPRRPRCRRSGCRVAGASPTSDASAASEGGAVGRCRRRHRVLVPRHPDRQDHWGELEAMIRPALAETVVA